jgi:hypothetical protein
MERQMIVRELKERVALGRYDVDCDAVAAAFLARQRRCENPLTVCSPVELERVIPAGPRITRPTGSSPVMPGGDDAASSS